MRDGCAFMRGIGPPLPRRNNLAENTGGTRRLEILETLPPRRARPAGPPGMAGMAAVIAWLHNARDTDRSSSGSLPRLHHLIQALARGPPVPLVA